MILRPVPSALPVCCVLLERDDLVLVARRPPGKHLAGQWEFPGGKIEPGEDAATALVREIREELGCDITIHATLPVCIHAYDTVNIALHPLVARLAPGSPVPHTHEHTATDWLPVDRLDAIELAAADVPVLAAYRDWRQNRR